MSTLGPLRKVALLIALITGAASACAETMVAEGRVLKVVERGYVLQVGTEPLAVEDTPETKFWRSKAEAKRDAFKEGDVVTARVKTDVDPPMLRELADRDSWKWLEANRKEPRRGTIEKLDSKYLTLKMADGSTFRYRATDKTKVVLKGKPDAGLAELDSGMSVSVQGRTLANLDTWAAVISDEVLLPKPKAGDKPKKSKPLPPLPTSGKLEGTVLGHAPSLRMFDIVSGVRTLHISYNSETKFLLNGRQVGPKDLQKDQVCLIHYRRDRQGRILSLKVELWR